MGCGDWGAAVQRPSPHRISSPSPAWRGRAGEGGIPTMHAQAQNRRHILPPAADETPETWRGLALAGGARLADVADLGDAVAAAPGARQEVDAVLAVIAAQANAVEHRAPRGHEAGCVVAHRSAEQQPREAVDDVAEQHRRPVAARVPAAPRI